MSDDLTSLDDFRGLARLFPLPNLVLFPSVIQPLHIFEPRYRQLMEDALKDDRLIGMALLRPGYEEDYHNNPPIYPVICLGRIHQGGATAGRPMEPVAARPDARPHRKRSGRGSALPHSPRCS